jgi:hypothetical protein
LKALYYILYPYLQRHYKSVVLYIKKMVEIRILIKAQCFDKVYSVPITDFSFMYTYAEYNVAVSFRDVNKLAFPA